MVLNTSKIKTEALLLFCADLIESYKDNDENIYGIDEDTVKYIKVTMHNMLNEIRKSTKPRIYYINNSTISSVRAILLTYDFIRDEISREFQENTPFNPAMLCLSLLATWFAELGHESKSKKYLYFSLFIYGDVYDKLLIKQQNNEFKTMNISMIERAEKIISNLHDIKIF